MPHMNTLKVLLISKNRRKWEKTFFLKNETLKVKYFSNIDLLQIF